MPPMAAARRTRSSTPAPCGAGTASDPGSRVPERPDHRAGPRPYWLHAYWELAARPWPGPGRPGAGLAHGPADPPPHGRVQRRYHSAAERQVRDIAIHGGVNNWYIDVLEPPAIVPDRHRLPVAARQVLRPGAFERRHDSQGRGRPIPSTRTGPTSRSSSTGSESLVHRQFGGHHSVRASTFATCSRSGCAGRCAAFARRTCRHGRLPRWAAISISRSMPS